MSDLIDTTEMYLRTIYELEEEGIVPMRARIAERIGHSGPTVSQTVARMERDGLLQVSGDRHLELTGAGWLKAMRVMRKHRLAERVLLDVIGLEWELVHAEACRWEHVISDRVERKLLALLADPGESPYGNPIPGLAELTADPGQVPSSADGVAAPAPPLQSLPEAVRRASGPGAVAEDGGVALVVRRIGESVQSESVLAEMERVPLRPGRRVVARRVGDRFRVRGDADAMDLAEEHAVHVFVAGPGTDPDAE